MLELGEIDGPIPVNVRLFQDIVNKLLHLGSTEPSVITLTGETVHKPAQVFPVQGSIIIEVKDAEGIVGLDVWSCCITKHAQEVQEVLKAQAVSGRGRGEDLADSLLEGVGLELWKAEDILEGHSFPK